MDSPEQWRGVEVETAPVALGVETIGALRFRVMLTRGGAVRWFRVARLATDSEHGELSADAD